MKNLEIHNTGAQITPKIRGQLRVQKKLLMEEKSRKPILQRMLVTGSEEEGGTKQECDSSGN